MKVKDLTNQVFGHLTAVRRDDLAPRKWVCKCGCGVECLVEGSKLWLNRRTSCGCRGVEDIVGKRFGYLTVLKLKEIRNQKTFFECVCDCGKVAIVGRCKLLNSHTRSCGCLYVKTREEERKAFGASAARSAVAGYKRNAEARHIAFDLTDEKALDLLRGDCWYCGAGPQRKVELKTGYGFFMCNGIDRLNNDLGYVTNNVVSACKKCNTKKQAESIDGFLGWVKKIAEHRLGMTC